MWRGPHARSGEVIIRHVGFFPLFGLAEGVLGASFLLILRLPETARRGAAELAPLRATLAGSGPLLLGGILVGWVFGTLSTFVPVTRIAAGPGRVGLFFFAYSAGLIAVRVAGSYGISDIVQPKVLLPGYGVLAAGLALLPLGSSGLRLVLVGLSCGAAHGVIMPVIYALLLVDLPRHRRGWGVALLAAAYDLGVVLASMGLGLLAEGIGIRGIFEGLGRGRGLGRGGRARMGPAMIFAAAPAPTAEAFDPTRKRRRRRSAPQEKRPAGLRWPRVRSKASCYLKTPASRAGLPYSHDSSGR